MYAFVIVRIFLSLLLLLFLSSCSSLWPTHLRHEFVQQEDEFFVEISIKINTKKKKKKRAESSKTRRTRSPKSDTNQIMHYVKRDDDSFSFPLLLLLLLCCYNSPNVYATAFKDF